MELDPQHEFHFETGRALADIVTGVQLPAGIIRNAPPWSACTGGAMQVDEHIAAIGSTGLRLRSVRDSRGVPVHPGQRARRDEEVRCEWRLDRRDQRPMRTPGPQEAPGDPPPLRPEDSTMTTRQNK